MGNELLNGKLEYIEKNKAFIFSILFILKIKNSKSRIEMCYIMNNHFVTVIN